MNEKYFNIKYIPNKNKYRKIVTYRDDNSIRKLHMEIVEFLDKNSIPSKFAKAYIKHRSIIINAKAHMYNDIFIKLDVKSFFNNIDHKKLVEILYYELNKKKRIIGKSDCVGIVDKCSIGSKGLPIGLITSPILSNLYLKSFDGYLYGVLKSLDHENVIYTRYSDDLVISFKNNRLDIDNACRRIIGIVEKLLKKYKLELNNSKTKMFNFNKSNHVKITGINITKDAKDYRHLSIGRKRKNDLFWAAVDYFENDTKNEEELLKIKGMLSFVLSVEKKDFDKCYSDGMIKKLKDLGFLSLAELITNLK